MTPFLLDVNLLLALTDPLHLHHDLAHLWFQEENPTWATCPITENGFVRVASHPKYPNRPGEVPTLLEILSLICQSEKHQFWEDSVSLLQIVEPGVVLSHENITDVYLLGLAVDKGGKLATLDQKIPAYAVRGGEAALEVLV